jgi:hypothetical protein
LPVLIFTFKYLHRKTTLHDIRCPVYTTAKLMLSGPGAITFVG